MEPASSDDVRAVIEYLLVTDPDRGTPVAVIAWTGLSRRGRSVLRWEDVDFKKGNLTTRRSVAAVPGGSQVEGTKTRDLRRIAIGPKTMNLLKDHKKRSDDEPRDATPGQAVFLGIFARPVWSTAFERTPWASVMTGTVGAPLRWSIGTGVYRRLRTPLRPRRCTTRKNTTIAVIGLGPRNGAIT